MVTPLTSNVSQKSLTKEEEIPSPSFSMRTTRTESIIVPSTTFTASSYSSSAMQKVLYNKDLAMQITRFA